jgi:Glycosyltransferase
MRIGLFSDTYPPYVNGVSTSVLALQRALEKEGHEVFIVTVNSENMHYKYENHNKIILIPGIPIKKIYDYRLTGFYPFQAINRIKAWKLDIIHSHTEFGVGTFARIIAKQLHIPIIHTYHTMYEDYTHYITRGYFDGTSKKIVKYLTKFYCDTTVQELIVPTKKAYDLFKGKYRYRRNVHIIPTGIETEKFSEENCNKSELAGLRDKYSISANDFIILYVGRIAKEKNLDVLFNAHTKLIRSGLNCKLLIIGDGPDKEHFKTMAHDLNISDNVIFTGKVPLTRIPNYYHLASLFVTPSKSETQGLTVVEAMAASIPVIAANDDAFRDIVIEGLNGYLFNSEDECCDQIKSLITDPDKLKDMSEHARMSSEKHSSKNFALHVLEIYTTALKDFKHKRVLKTIRKIFGRK